MQISIREMTKGDWADVSKIYAQGIAEGKSTFQTEVPEFDEWDKAHLKKCRFVILCGNTVSGWCALSPVSARAAYRGVAEVSIYIDAAYRGHGLGTKLLNHLCANAEGEGFWSLLAVVFAVNEASIALHKKCGFREIGYRERIAQDRFGNWQNTIMFEKRF